MNITTKYSIGQQAYVKVDLFDLHNKFVKKVRVVGRISSLRIAGDKAPGDAIEYCVKYETGPGDGGQEWIKERDILIRSV